MEVNTQFNISFSEEDDHVKIDADSLASSLRESMPANFSFSKKCCIFKIPNILRRHNPKAFVPNAFSIGPWHHGGKKLLKQAEEIKLNYLRRLISRFPERMLLEELIQAIREIEKDVRAHYAEPIDMSADDFVKLLVIDGCFIIEVFRRNYYERFQRQDYESQIPTPYSSAEYDPIFHMSCMLQYLHHDLILLENQIPWSVLELLFYKTMQLESPSSLEYLVILFFSDMFSLIVPPSLNSYQGNNHILDLLREWLVSLPAKEGDVAFLSVALRVAFLRITTFLRDNFLNVAAFLRVTAFLRVIALWVAFLRVTARWVAFLCIAFLRVVAFLHVAAFLRKFGRLQAINANKSELVWQPMPSAQSLNEAGIEFRKREFKEGESMSILDVKFVDGVLEVPSLLIQETTEVIFRNLISFEQCYTKCTAKITSYAIFLDNLINTKKDLEILCEEGIIVNWLNPDVTTRFFNKLYHDVYRKEYYYLGVCEDVNNYRTRSWPKWRAAYMRNYFGTPWAIVSQVFALVILILTVMQTVFSIIK